MTQGTGSARTVLPAWKTGTLADVIPALAAHVAPDIIGAEDVIGLPDASRYVIVMVDGLGYDLLRLHRNRVPYLGALLRTAKKLTCGVPSTTAASLTSLGTGLPPGQHGTVGYRFRLNGSIVNALAWDTDADPLLVQPLPTWPERLTAVGVRATTISPAHFEDSGLTLAGMRGAQFVGMGPSATRYDYVTAAVEASRQGEKSVVYVYERELDHTGHAEGCGSVPWRATLDAIDEYLENLRNSLEPDVVMIVTGDHGMVDIPEGNRLIMEDSPQLLRDVDLVGGEGRLRQLYTSDPEAVTARWAEVLGERALIVTRDESIARGWWGPQVDPRIEDRIGDVLVAMKHDWAMMTTSLPGELSLVGQHGSLTPVEMNVPLLIDGGFGWWSNAQ